MARDPFPPHTCRDKTTLLFISIGIFAVTSRIFLILLVQFEFEFECVKMREKYLCIIAGSA